MAYMIKILKSELKTRKLALPRLGFIVDGFGYQIVVKHPDISFPKILDTGLAMVKDLKSKVESSKPVKKAAAKAAAAKKSTAVSRAAEVAAEIGNAAGRNN